MWIVGDNCCIVTTCPGKLTIVSSRLFEIADDSSLRHVADRHHIANGDVGFLATVHELSGVHTFSGHEQLLLGLVPVWVTEVDDSQWCTTAGVVDDVTDDTLERTELSSL